jgi:DNA invertase Pin-like site-specific DNA recombinase
VRVSTEDQARDGVSLDAQQVKLEAYALVKDWTLLTVIGDEGCGIVTPLMTTPRRSP